MAFKVRRPTLAVNLQRIASVLSPAMLRKLSDDAPQTISVDQPGIAWRWWSDGQNAVVQQLPD